MKKKTHNEELIIWNFIFLFYYIKVLYADGILNIDQESLGKFKIHLFGYANAITVAKVMCIYSKYEQFFLFAKLAKQLKRDKMNFG